MGNIQRRLRTEHARMLAVLRATQLGMLSSEALLRFQTGSTEMKEK
jgi:hypothetical protein